ncbi:MAG: DNA repair protein RecN [Sarcina sp.]
MLLQISIENFALIERLSLDFKDGFNILSGETGAGKSILIDSINYVLGSKFNKDLIRIGSEKTFVEAVFSVDNTNKGLKELLEELEIEYDDILIISRESFSNGKNISKINGKSVILNNLRKITSKLIDIHGQHNNQNLLNRENHIIYLDSYCSETLNEKLDDYKEDYSKLKAIENRINELSKEGKNEKLIDYLEYQIKEIKDCKLVIGEEEELNERYNLISNSEKISLALNNSYNVLNGSIMGGESIIDYIGTVNRDLSAVEQNSKNIERINSQISTIFYDLQEIARELNVECATISYDDKELEAINSRIYEINSLKRKYGETVEIVLEYKKNLEKQLEEMVDSERIIESLNKDKEKILALMETKAKVLHDYRLKAGEVLQGKIKDELKYIGLGKCDFQVEVLYSEDFNQRGKDLVQFLISTNPGQPMKPMEKIVSGGELSRIMLALKIVFSDKDKIPTVIFDEIDTGISGQIAQSVAEKMYEFSVKHQVFCISHLPQIASMSDNHYFVYKSVINKMTSSKVKKITEEEKIKEIAKMLGGVELTEKTLLNAKEMVDLAERKKEDIKKHIKIV